MEEWQLGQLAAKVAQYCGMMSDLNAEVLFEASRGGDFEALRAYLRKRGSEAYNQKASMGTWMTHHKLAGNDWCAWAVCASALERDCPEAAASFRKVFCDQSPSPDRHRLGLLRSFCGKERG